MCSSTLWFIKSPSIGIDLRYYLLVQMVYVSCIFMGVILPKRMPFFAGLLLLVHKSIPMAPMPYVCYKSHGTHIVTPIWEFFLQIQLSDLLLPEQEYYLQPVEPGRSRNVTSIFPVDFSFGGDHLWDKFSVFVLYTDGSLYILCPVVPFGSFYKWEYILEIYSDAHAFGLKSANSTAVSNSNLAISWLEATFPELANQEAEGGDLSMLRAHPYALCDASISLQGPLRKVCHGGDENFAVQGAECKGRAVSFLYNLVSNYSILVTAWSGGQLQIDALADEIQPVWNLDSPPRLRVDPNDQVLGLAMICESIEGELPIVKLDQLLDHTSWLGHPAPLLRLAIVDLALPRETCSGSLIMMFADPLLPERLFSLHDGGIDSIVLHFLPFTNQTGGKDETMRTPSVHPILSTCQGENPVQSPLCGFVSLSDSFGYSWIVGVTVCQECVVLEMKTWNPLLPMRVDMDKSISLHEQKERDIPDIISKELLLGPKAILLPQAQPNLRSVAADSIEGRQILHQYFKPFHENYVEYADMTGMEKDLFGSHPYSLAATKSHGPPPAFASDPLIAVPSLGGMDNNASSPLVAQDEINVIAGYSAAAGAGSSKVPDILEVDGPSMAGNFMKGSSPQIKSPKIAIIDSGIDDDFLLFARNVEEDCIVAKSRLFYRSGGRERDEKDRTDLDIHGHGTKVAAIAAGRKIEAKLYKTFPITIEGSASFADLYIYKTVWKEKGTNRKIINPNSISDAFEAAIEDEVDVICLAIARAIR
ncbi:nuclear pore complex protein NUP88 isoform X3 [Quercus suber]|uniref:nuclear pore complex protein NUP88 isoform X3 n=1 Tax=Quercus suber TaxID=58331 RepID=UPI0032DEB516